jgi:hypothetical protein
MIVKNDNGVKYCTNCRSYHSFPNLTKTGECAYCVEDVA